MGFLIKIKHIVILMKKHDGHETQDDSHTALSHGERTTCIELCLMERGQSHMNQKVHTITIRTVS